MQLPKSSTGIQGLDEITGGGLPSGRPTLVCGSAGCGKTLLSGVDLTGWIEKGLLRFQPARPTLSGLELHLMTMLRLIREINPHVVVLDPLNSFVTPGNEVDVKLMLLRLVNSLKLRGTTGFFTSLTSGGDAPEHTDVAVSSLIDTWLLVRDLENGGERNRALCVLKSRGMAHSNQVREFALTVRGVELRDAYVGPWGVLSGSARLAQEAQERAEHLRMDQDIHRKQEELQRRREAMETKVQAICAEFAAQESAAMALIEEAKANKVLLVQDRQDMAQSRMVNG